MATSPPTTTAPPVMTQGKFVLKGKLLKDLRAALLEDPTNAVNAQLLDKIKIVQECDFEDQLITALEGGGELSLPAYIRLYVRDNASDNTDLPAMQRFFLNPKTGTAGSTAISMVRTSDDNQPALVFKETLRPVDFLATKNTPWHHNPTTGVFDFTRKSVVKLNLSFLAGMNVPDTPASALQWRYSDTGINRIVTCTPVLHLEGNLTNGSKLDIPLPGSTFFPEHYDRNLRVPIQHGFRLAVLDPDGQFGRVDKLSLSMQRSTWVAQSASGIYDRVGFFKTTGAGVLDTSNYLEFTEV